jgi:predicted NBD/HSP70 family sugar kinase
VRTSPRNIGDQVYEDCVTKVSSNQRVARRWPRAHKAEVIVCQTSENDAFVNDVMDYAQFESAAALSTALKTARPDGSYCTIGRAIVILDDEGGARDQAPGSGEVDL